MPEQMTPTVEALIVSFNTRDLLRQVLETLAHHAPAGITLTASVIDNGSTDGSAEMVESEFPSVKLVRSERNLGFGQANNHLISLSHAEYLLLLNSDVIVVDDFISILLEELRADPALMLVGPRLVYPDGALQYSAPRLPKLRYEIARLVHGKRLGRVLSPVYDSRDVLRMANDAERTEQLMTRYAEFVWATCWLIKRSDLPNSGILFDPDFPLYDEDLDVCRRAGASGARFGYVPRAELVHVGGASSVSDIAKQRRMRTARTKYYRRHHGQLHALSYQVLAHLLLAIISLSERLPRPSIRPKRHGRT